MGADSAGETTNFSGIPFIFARMGARKAGGAENARGQRGGNFLS